MITGESSGRILLNESGSLGTLDFIFLSFGILGFIVEL